MSLADPDSLAERFEAHRTRMRAIAYRMLGSVAEADDAVQDAWLRFSRTDATAIDNLGGWLTTVVARLCLDRLRTRASRREDLAGLHLPEPLIGPADTAAMDPASEVLLADSIGLAMLVVLERLSPAERLSFVLHDTFGLPFDDIGRVIDRSPEAARQLASRGRRRVRAGIAPAHVPPARQRELVDAFLAAARAGDFEGLLRVLDPDVVRRADVGTLRVPFGSEGETRGAAAVAKQALTFRQLATHARPATINGTAGLVVFSGNRPFSVLAFAFGGRPGRERIVEIDILVDPERLARLDLGGLAPA